LNVLITNDDGIDASALPVLARALVDAGHNVRIVAPHEGYSGCGASIGSVAEGHRVRVERVYLSGVTDIPSYAVVGPPALIVLAALQGRFGPCPDVVVTGPNSGLNLGPLVLHSGTLGAALTAASNGVPAIALSTEKRARHGYATASQFCQKNLNNLVAAMQPYTVLNINVPDLPLDEVQGVRQTRLAIRSLVEILLLDDDQQLQEGSEPVNLRIELNHDDNRSLHMQWRSTLSEQDDTDAGAIVDGFISVTVVYGGLRHVDGHHLHASLQAF
jgi:5'-nucleotidase